LSIRHHYVANEIEALWKYEKLNRETEQRFTLEREDTFASSRSARLVRRRDDVPELIQHLQATYQEALDFVPEPESEET
jgi:hypothetical protein